MGPVLITRNETVDDVLSVIVCICMTITNRNRLYAVGAFSLAVCFRQVVVSCVSCLYLLLVFDKMSEM